MRGRESGMPEIELWETLFDAAEIVEKLSDPDCRQRSVKFGSGYGTFSLPSAKLASVSHVLAIDIDIEMLAVLRQRLTDAGLANVSAIERDFITDGTGLADGSIDWVLMFYILHVEQPMLLLNEAFRITRPGGILSIIHWRSDIETPRGPTRSIRPTMQHCRQWADVAGFVFDSSPVLSRCPWHWGLKMRVPRR